MPPLGYNVNPNKAGRRAIHSSSGDLIIFPKTKKGKKETVIKFFLEGNAVQPTAFGRNRQSPPKNHAVVEQYADLLNSKPSKTKNERIYGPPPPATYHVRPVALIRQGKNYHVIERVKGPNLHDFLRFVETKAWPKFVPDGPHLEKTKVDISLRRQGLANLLTKQNRTLLEEWRPQRRNFMEELNEQMRYIKNAHNGMLDIYGHQMKETDFTVEGLEKGKDGKVRLKLVLVDFK